MSVKSAKRQYLLGGVSLIAVAMSGGFYAQAAGLSIVSSSTPSVTVTSAQAFDFIYIDDSVVTWGVENSGTIGIAGTADGVEITNGSVVGGVTNTTSGSIAASEVGILVHDSSLLYGVANAGQIGVNNSSAARTNTSVTVTNSSAFDRTGVYGGIVVLGDDVNTKVTNSGGLSVDVSGYGGSTASAGVIGGVGVGLFGNNSVAAEVDNSGDILVDVHAYGTVANVAAAGVFVGTTGTGNSDDILIANSGNIDVQSWAFGDSRARSRALGVAATATATGSALDVSFSNAASATLNVEAHALATGSSRSFISGTVTARAGADGIVLAGSGATAVTNTVSNDGNISITADARADGGYFFFTATSPFLSILSGPSVPWGFSTAGVVPASANAGVTGGVRQGAMSNGGPAIAALTNSGTLEIGANADASAISPFGSTGDNANANAWVSRGVSISAFETTYGNVARASLVNSGDIVIEAGARAVGWNAVAGADITEGIYLQAGGDISESLLENSNLILIRAAADATGFLASAEANISLGISQYIGSSTNTSGTASTNIALNNSGTIQIEALAAATDASSLGGIRAWAQATVSSAIYQAGSGRKTTSIALNNSGNIDITATVMTNGFGAGTFTGSGSPMSTPATGVLTSGDANVFMGVVQYANGDSSAGSSATVSLDNSNSLSIRAEAALVANDDLSVYASVYKGIAQGASDAETVRASIVNSGNIDIVAKAVGWSTRSSASDVSATVESGIYQSAQAGGAQLAATASFVNDGTVNISALAWADGYEDDISASALVQDGIVQIATDANQATAMLVNNGRMDILARASGYGEATDYDIDITAQVSSGIRQTAEADGTPGSVARASLVNSGNLSIGAEAYGIGSATDSFSITASISETVIRQSVSGGEQGYASLINSGNLDIFAYAEGKNTESSLFVSATVDTGIYQEASASGANSIARALFDNSGAININATALASAASSGTDASASADASDILRQYVFGAADVSARFVNSNAFNVTARAVATVSTNDSADNVTAEVDSVIGQTVEGDGSVGSTATGSIVNSGDIVIKALAFAYGESDSYSDASASVSTAFEQRISGAETATASLVNNGLVDIYATAIAKGDTADDVSAEVDFQHIVQQSAIAVSSTGTAVARFVNNGDFRVSGFASATGDSNISASVSISSAVEQYANGADATVDFTNNGLFELRIEARAIASDEDATANASMSESVISQGAYGNGLATDIARTSFTNTGTFRMRADAFASVGLSSNASANATIESAISQDAGSAGDVSVTFSNSGAFELLAYAKAIGGMDYSTAEANISSAIDQAASATGGAGDTASVAFSNSGLFTILASAFVEGDSYASANATVDTAIVQNATNAGTTRATFANSGVMNISAVARGYGSEEVSIEATIDSFVQQSARGLGNATDEATVSLTNSGTINLIANAWGSATDSYLEVTARVSDAFDQKARDAGTASVAFDNSGTILLNAIAFGFMTDSSSAEASIDTVVDQYARATGGVGDTATVSMTNSGTFRIYASAEASGTGHSLEATASVSDAISQTAANAETGTVTLTNSNLLDIRAFAFAGGSSLSTPNSVDASAQMSDTFRQNTNNITGTGRAFFDNTGAILVRGTASAVGGDYVDASVTFTSVFDQYVSASDVARADVSNSGTLVVQMNANASGEMNVNALAELHDDDPAFSQRAGDGAVASVTLDNSGTFGLDARAIAKGLTDVYAGASVSTTVVSQRAELADEMTVEINNSGTMRMLADAKATAENGAYAFAKQFQGVIQRAGSWGGGGNLASATLDNSNSLYFGAVADASAASPYATARAEQRGGVAQYAFAALENRVTVTNSGDLVIEASAIARARSSLVDVNILNSNAVYQGASGAGDAGSVASASLTNTGKIDILSVADAQAELSANVNAQIGTTTTSWTSVAAIYQQASSAEAASVSMINDGSIRIKSSATGSVVNPSGATANATVKIANPIMQDASGIDSARASIVNNDRLVISGLATAEASLGMASVSVGAVSQRVLAGAGGNAVASFENSGQVLMTVGANGSSNGSASIKGLAQGFSGAPAGAVADFNFANSGTFVASAEASASTSFATASATGYTVAPGAGNAANLGFNNTGYMGVFANADSLVFASANAEGVKLSGPAFTGSFENAGTIEVTASALASFTAISSAIGIHASVDDLQATLVNSGLISVALNSFAGGNATGVKFDNFSGGGTGTATFRNDGGRIRAVVNTGGLPIRANAIETEGAAYNVLVELQGNAMDGDIFGNIEIAAGDMIEVSNGLTLFDGMVNPDTLREGTLDIFGSGTLMLANNQSYTTAAEVNIDSFTVQSDGTIGIQIDDGGIASSINANSAALDGTIYVSAVAGTYASTQSYLDVIDASFGAGRTGTFSVEMVNTPLLDLAVVYDGDTVDLTLTRVAFSSVANLTPNQSAVAAAIEATYGDANPSPFDGMVNELFGLTGPQYQAALDSISGVEYADSLQGALGSFRLLNNAVDWRYDDPTGGAGGPRMSSKGTAEAGRTTFWANAQVGFGTQNGDGNAAGYSYTSMGTFAGLDRSLTNNFTVGIAGGAYSPGMLNYDNGNTLRQSAGYQAGLYANYDNGSFYARGAAAYGAWNADVTRQVTVGAVTGINQATFGVDALMARGEVGYRLERNSVSYTPYLGVEYNSANIGNVTETGLTSAALQVSGSSSQIDAIVGVKFAGEFDMNGTTIMPNFNVGYRTNLSGTTSIQGAFIDDVTGDTFSILGPEHGGTFMVGVGMTAYTSGNMAISVGYDGEFGATQQEHAVYGKFSIDF